MKDKYQVSKVYYFLWYMQDENEWLYTNLQEAGFIVVFKKQMIEMKTHKKWNIDSDLIFHIMKKLIDKPNDFNQIVLVSGDWDFKILVDFLIKKDRLRKVLFPNKKYASSLYNGMTNYFFDYMNNIKSKIEHKKINKKEAKKESDKNLKKTTKKVTKKVTKRTTKAIINKVAKNPPKKQLKKTTKVITKGKLNKKQLNKPTKGKSDGKSKKKFHKTTKKTIQKTLK